MGIVFQKSSLLALDAKTKRKRTMKLKKTTKRKLMSRRQVELDSLVEEARVWMYAMMLPTDIIANSDAEIKKSLDHTIDELTAKLLGTKIDKEKVSRICGRIAEHILIPGLANREPGSRFHARLPPPSQLKTYLDHKHINAEVLQTIYDNCKDFQRDHPDARTWREVREAFGGRELPDGWSIDWLNAEQSAYTYRELGVQFDSNPTAAEVKELSARIRSANSDKLDRLGNKALHFDLVVVRAGGNSRRGNYEAIASMSRNCNIMHLHPIFYSELKIGGSLRDMLIVAGQTDLDAGGWELGVTVLLHEITHSAGVLGTFDHQFRYVESELDVLKTENVVSFIVDSTLENGEIQQDTYVKAYGLDACLALTRRDERDNTNKAEDNADSWALYFTIRMLILAYPEIDFLAAVKTEDLLHPPDRILQRRETLLHHCTLFERLRSREPPPPIPQGGIRNQIGYDSSKDHWSISAGRGDARTLTDILEILQAISHRKDRKSERNRRAKAKKKAKGKLKKKKKVKVEGESASLRLQAELSRLISLVFNHLRTLWRR